jgi:hypothetical protein
MRAKVLDDYPVPTFIALVLRILKRLCVVLPLDHVLGKRGISLVVPPPLRERLNHNVIRPAK